MTENYYMTQLLLPNYFKNEKNRDFFYKVIGASEQNRQIFFEKELYSWVKEDFAKQQEEAKKLTEEDKTWKYSPIKSMHDVIEGTKWVVVFVQFPPDFVKQSLDSICVAIAMKKEESDIVARVFMLETGKTHDGEPVTYVCERDIEEGTHINRGIVTFDEKYMQSFYDRIVEIIK